MEPRNSADGPSRADDSGRLMRARMMTLLTRALSSPDSSHGDEPPEPLLLRMCRALVEATGGTGGTLTLAPNELHRVTLCTTDDTAARLENLQEVIGEGPVSDAAGAGHVVVAELGSSPGTSRWPMLSATVADAIGAVVMYAFPLHPEPGSIGVASVYRRPDGTAWRPSLEEASLLADMIGAAIVSSGLDADTGLDWHEPDRISQATGMVIAQLGIGPDDAVALMRAAAFSDGLDLGQMAIEILEYRRDFRTDPEHRGDLT